MPRTAWGHPDLQGTYTNKTITPLERPAELAGRELLTAQEAAGLEREAAALNAELLARPARRTVVTENVNVGEDGAPGYYNNFWLDAGVTSTGRTSLIVDPPDGRLPPLTPAAQQDEDARMATRAARGPADTWTDLDLNDRCMLWSAGPPMLPDGYNNYYLILQTPEYVAIQVEMIHDTRIIPLDGRPRLGRPIPQWLGEMRGRWEGDTPGRRDPPHRPQRGGIVLQPRCRPHPRPERGPDREPAGGRTVYTGRRRHHPLRVHRGGPDALDPPVVRRASPAADRRAALRVRLPRGQLRSRQHAERCQGRGAGVTVGAPADGWR